ncbi:MAG: SRPBCC domain-containing protein [Flavobacteriaceae bacterium]|nr:SRPBCC domain-containing protein [Flavobacteriaceae bacterium]
MNKIKYQLEFDMKCSTTLLFEYIGTSSGMSEWLADEVTERGDEFTFVWGGQEETANLIRYKEESFVRFRWQEDEGTKCFWELAINVDDVTNDVALVITDFAEEDDLEHSKLYWTNLIDDLRKIIGS